MEAGLCFHRIQEDKPIVEIADGEKRLVKPTADKNSISYTLMMICDPQKNDPPVNPAKEQLSYGNIKEILVGSLV